MALTPNNNRYGQAFFGIANSVDIGHRIIRATKDTTWPNSHVETTTISFLLADVSTGATPPTGIHLIAALVEDAVDTGGDYVDSAGTALVSGVVAVLDLGLIQNQNGVTITFGDGSDPAGAGRSINPAINKGGTYRLVFASGTQTGTTPPTAGTFLRAARKSAVNTGGTSGDSHRDSDGYGAAGGASTSNSTITDKDVGVCGRRVVVTALTPTAGNWKYGQSNQVSASLRPAGATSAALIGTKEVKLALGTGSGNGAPSAKLLRASPSSTVGDITYSGIPVDSGFGQVLGGTAHFTQLGVNDNFGDATTPTNERADIYAIGTAVGTTTAQRAAYLFAASGHAAGITVADQGRIRTTTATLTASSAIQLFKESALTNLGASVYNESGRTNLNRYCHRRQSSSLTGPHGQPFLRAYLADAYGAALASTATILRVLDSDATQEDSQNKSSIAGGELTWDYVLGDTHKAFSAFKRTSPDNPDALGAHDLAIPTADVYKPAGTKTGTFPDPKNPPTTRDFGAATFPARAKDVRVIGNAFAGVNEPQATYADQFGVHAEIIYAGMWTGNTTDRTITADGAPDLPVTRSKVTAAGSYACKTCDVVNEATFLVNDLTRHNPTDRAGRPYSYGGGFEFVGQRARFNRTTFSAEDTGTALVAAQNLETPLGYSNDATASNTFDLVAAPSDATTYGYYQGFAAIASQRDTFGLAAGSTETPGFTGDSGLYGWRVHTLEYSLIRDDLLGELILEPMLVVPGQAIRFKAKAWRILPDKTRVARNFNEPPTVYVSRDGTPGGAITQVAVLTMDPIGTPPTGDYEATYTPANPTSEGVVQTYGASLLGKIEGGNVMTAPALFTVGLGDRRATVIVGGADLSNLKIHFSPGGPLTVGAALVKDGSKLAATAATVILGKFDPALGTTRYLDASNAFVTGEPAFQHTLAVSPGDPNVWLKTFNAAGGFDTSGWGDEGLFVLVKMVRDNVVYVGSATVVVAGNKNQHDRYRFDGGGFVGFPQK